MPIPPDFRFIPVSSYSLIRTLAYEQNINFWHKAAFWYNIIDRLLVFPVS